MNDKQLDEVLEELGREHRAIGAPQSLRRVLYAAAESRKAAAEQPRMPAKWAWAAVLTLLAVVAVAGAFWRSLHAHPAQTQVAGSVPAPQLKAEPSHPSPATSGQSIQPKTEPVRKPARVHAPLRTPSPEAPAPSSLDVFVPLPASEALPAAAELSIVRIRLRGTDLQQYGLQTPAEAQSRSMLAEFAVGEDGLPRAIRIVR